MAPRKKTYTNAVLYGMGAGFSFIFGIVFVQWILSRNYLTGISSYFENIITISSIVQICLMVSLLLLLYLSKPWSIIVTLILSISACVLYLSLLVITAVKTTYIVDSYGYVFEKPEYFRFGDKLQLIHQCCGWMNTSDVPVELSCTGTEACRKFVKKDITLAVVFMDISCAGSIILLSISCFYIYKFLKETLHPISNFDELTLAPLDNQP
ncbi:hypothetical protein TVAG_279970 [Trichomonas vaginalis G3]|uniref:Tetraspanin family protein n=1 Tax=Trichomonas vaginalis (strain ATCC PRA-98 / G3) TaxID=412133 RepID=A2FBL0_TRIV3|nr:hypothetical protein TVAGG3_0809150 [Trichomonas vaginalis G3]EAX97696.1 hypothetical protein TVAG_279970 [Trichomonas vaginalis G3]KAI5497073.1 hypothetical protein TVAGG3_0809150 [Trichomonas vaginalis G3]|eukprot:XP_001310626.1 hypothetical protein [Trichomonas vaginalis G3]